MKHILLLCLSFSLALSSSAQGIDFFKGEWSAALEQARAQDKLIFVDAYAVWCGPCKRMSSDVFPDEQVGAFYNRNFISLKIDMEAPENAEFRAKYPVAAFPTLFYINAEGEVVQSVKGAMDATKFINTGKAALALAEPSDDYAAAYEEGNREPELVYKYVRSLIRNNESHLRVSNDYLRSQTDLKSAENLSFILLAATEADSRIFEMMIEHKDEIIQLNSEDLFYSQVYAACEATAQKAIEYSSPELLEDACDKMDKHHPVQSDKFRYQHQMNYAVAHRDAKTYADAARSYAKDVIAGDATLLNDFALQLANAFDNDKRVLDVAKYAITESIKVNSDTFRPYYSLAIIEKKMGNNKGAKAAALKARVLAEEGAPNAVKMINGFLEGLEEG